MNPKIPSSESDTTPAAENAAPADIAPPAPAAQPVAMKPAEDPRTAAYARDQARQAATHTRSRGERFRRKQEPAKRTI